MRWISSGSGSKLVLFNKERGVIYFFFDAEVNKFSTLELTAQSLAPKLGVKSAEISHQISTYQHYFITVNAEPILFDKTIKENIVYGVEFDNAGVQNSAFVGDVKVSEFITQ